jgi:hypothetical protein
MPVAGAALVSAGIGAFSAKKSRDAAKDAARQQAAGQERAAGQLRPFQEFGARQISGLEGLLGGGDADQRNAFLRNTPGFDFAFSEGQRAVNTAAGTAGLFGSGARAKALTRFGQGLAGGTLTQERNALFRALDVGRGAGVGVANLEAQQGATQAAGTVGANAAFQTGLTNVVGALGEAGGAFFQNRQQNQLQAGLTAGSAVRQIPGISGGIARLPTGGG